MAQEGVSYEDEDCVQQGSLGCRTKEVYPISAGDSVSRGSNPRPPAGGINDLVATHETLPISCGGFAGLELEGTPRHHQFRPPTVALDDAVCRLDQTRQIGCRIVGRNPPGAMAQEVLAIFETAAPPS
jgi:hypothetical protein